MHTESRSTPNYPNSQSPVTVNLFIVSNLNEGINICPTTSSNSSRPGVVFICVASRLVGQLHFSLNDSQWRSHPFHGNDDEGSLYHDEYMNLNISTVLTSVQGQSEMRAMMTVLPSGETSLNKSFFVKCTASLNSTTQYDSKGIYFKTLSGIYQCMHV